MSYRGVRHASPDVLARIQRGVDEAKVGSVLEEPLEVLGARALVWRNDPFVVERIGGIKNAHDWARAARVLDRKYGFPDDLLRIARRNAS